MYVQKIKEATFISYVELLLLLYIYIFYFLKNNNNSK